MNHVKPFNLFLKRKKELPVFNMRGYMRTPDNRLPWSRFLSHKISYEIISELNSNNISDLSFSNIGPCNLPHNIILNFIKSFLKNLSTSNETNHKKLSSFYGFLSSWNALELEDQQYFCAGVHHFKTYFPCSSLVQLVFPVYEAFIRLLLAQLPHLHKRRAKRWQVLLFLYHEQ